MPTQLLPVMDPNPEHDNDKVPYEHSDDSSSTVPRVRLPVITAGTINIAAAIKLQDELEETKKKLEKASSLFFQPLSGVQLRDLINKNPTLEELLKFAIEKNIKSRVENETQRLGEYYRKEFEAESAATKEVQNELQDTRRELRKTRRELETTREENKAQLRNLGKEQVELLLKNNSPLQAMFNTNVKREVDRQFDSLKKMFDEKIEAADTENRKEKEAYNPTTNSAILKEKQNALKLKLVEAKLGDLKAQLQTIEHYAKLNPNIPVVFAWKKAISKPPTTPKPTATSSLTTTSKSVIPCDPILSTALDTSTTPVPSFGLTSWPSPTSWPSSPTAWPSPAIPATPSQFPSSSATFLNSTANSSSDGRSPFGSVRNQAPGFSSVGSSRNISSIENTTLTTPKDLPKRTTPVTCGPQNPTINMDNIATTPSQNGAEAKEETTAVKSGDATRSTSLLTNNQSQKAAEDSGGPAIFTRASSTEAVCDGPTYYQGSKTGTKREVDEVGSARQERLKRPRAQQYM